MRQSETQYRLLFESNPIPMGVFSRDTLRLLAVNRAAVRHSKLREAEFLKMSIAEAPARDGHGSSQRKGSADELCRDLLIAEDGRSNHREERRRSRRES